MFRTFAEVDTVYVKNFASGPKWLNGIIVAKEGSVNYVVNVAGIHMRCHVNHLHKRWNLDMQLNEPDIVPPPVLPGAENARGGGQS